MRLFGLSILALALVPAASRAVGLPLAIIENFDGAKVVVNLDERDIAAAPAWRPAEGEPPMSIADMVAAVQRWTAGHPDLAEENIRKIELKPIHSHEGQRHWYYLVKMKNQSDVQAKPHYLAVMMNGKVLPAIREPSSYK